MGVFGAVFGRRGDAGFRGPLLGVSSGDRGFNGCCSGARSGVVGFNVATLSCLVREKVRPAELCHRESVKKFALHAHIGPKWAFSGVLGELFRGNVAEGGVLGEFFRGPAVVGSHRANFVAPQPWPPTLLLAVLTLRCAATPTEWKLDAAAPQPQQATPATQSVDKGKWLSGQGRDKP